MLTDFAWWLLVVGLVAGGGIVWLVTATGSAQGAAWLEDDGDPDGLESAWIARELGEGGGAVDEADIGRVLELHRSWLAGEPELDVGEPASAWTPPTSPRTEASEGASLDASPAPMLAADRHDEDGA